MNSTSTSSVGAQRAAGRDEVDDGVGQTDEGCQFHRAIELDQVDVHALAGEMFGGRPDVLRGHAQPRARDAPRARSRSPPVPPRPSGSGRCPGRPAGRGRRRRARAARPCRQRRGRRRRAGRKSVRRWHARSATAARDRRSGTIRLRLSTADGSTAIPQRASSGAVSSNIRPFDRASVSIAGRRPCGVRISAAAADGRG